MGFIIIMKHLIGGKLWGDSKLPFISKKTG